MSKGNIDAPRKSSGTKENSPLVGKPGFSHATQATGQKAAPGMSAGRGVGGAEHHKGSSFGGKADCFRGGSASPTSGKYGGQSIK